jgi:hypothetical protein
VRAVVDSLRTVRWWVYLLVLSGLAFSSCGPFHNTCRYGTDPHSSSNFDCASRPLPKGATMAAAFEPATLRAAIAAYRAGGHPGQLRSFGINRWGEATFNTAHAELTFDVHAQPTSGNEGYISWDENTLFPLEDLNPDIPARILSQIRQTEPDARLIQVILRYGPFIHTDYWRFLVGEAGADSGILYEANIYGGELCHGNDYASKDSLKPAPDVPACPADVPSF